MEKIDNKLEQLIVKILSAVDVNATFRQVIIASYTKGVSDTLEDLEITKLAIGKLQDK